MTQTIVRDLAALRVAVNGRGAAAGRRGYDEARSVWNGDIDRRPARDRAVRRPDDVAAALRFAQDAGLEVAVRGGGHGSGAPPCADGGLMIDLSPMTRVRVDPEARRARVGGGAARPTSTRPRRSTGSPCPAGTVSHTGVGGLTLGGGLGWFSRRHGLRSTTCVSAEVVLADGRSCGPPPTSTPTCSGRCAAAAATSAWSPSSSSGCTRSARSCSSGCSSGAGPGGEALRAARDVVSGSRRSRRRSARLNAPPAPFVPEEHHFAPGYVLVLVGFGDAGGARGGRRAGRGGAAAAVRRSSRRCRTSRCSRCSTRQPLGHRSYDKAPYLDEFTDDAIDALVARLAARRSAALRGPDRSAGRSHRGRPRRRDGVRWQPVAAVRGRDRVHGRPTRRPS